MWSSVIFISVRLTSVYVGPNQVFSLWFPMYCAKWNWKLSKSRLRGFSLWCMWISKSMIEGGLASL